MRITQRHSGPREPCNVVPDDENNAALKVSTRLGFTFWFIGPIIINKLWFIFKKVKNHNLRYGLVLIFVLVTSASASQVDDGDRFDTGEQTTKLALIVCTVLSLECSNKRAVG